eukprot:scaffold27102_cov57-Phaeocystis_antarctica.AAC.2
MTSGFLSVYPLPEIRSPEAWRSSLAGRLEPVYSIEFPPACPAFECGDDAVKLSRTVIVAHMSD